jgi:hypothetical protein
MPAAEAVPTLEIGLDKIGSLALTLAEGYPGPIRPAGLNSQSRHLRTKQARAFLSHRRWSAGEMAENYQKELELAVIGRY